ncbi:NAD(P)/FAD-dependent oxidoreductase [Paraflavitalea pollutisoli]|uniref:NAD(P)/FAD-dependent oxidoreductase n=1 Tax=Paraflavitalea pollutisoli TaxID=3034143 RepID=UPI0023EAF200|nr:FAD-dependent oxidoreductase [Paraflavitalea sp. H1-2-19X]
MSKQVTIIGGGIIGLSSAYYLQQAGHQVTVIERGDITDGTSFGNAGYVSPSHFVPLATPGIVAQGMRWMLRSDSPFYIKPRLNWDLIRWCLAFYKKANAANVEHGAPHLNNILHLSRELTIEMKHALGDNFDMQEIGCLMLYKNASTEKHEIELAEEAAHFKVDTKILTAQEVQAMEPDVELNVRGGVLYPQDCHMHPGKFMKSLKSHLQAAGVNLQLNTTVTGFETKAGKVTAVLTDKGKFTSEELVIANGSWMPELTKMLGVDLLLQAGKGYSITYEKVARNLRYPSILVDDRVAMTPMGADLRMGGTMEISGLQSPTLEKRAHAIYKAVKTYYPNLPVEFPKPEKIWSGLRPLSPDGLPYIGRHSKFANLSLAGGHAMLGVALGAGTGKLVQEIVQGSKPTIDTSAFSVERFK